MRDGRHGAGEQDLAIDCNTTDRDDGAAVRGRGDVLHVDGGVGFGLEVGETPAGGCKKRKKRDVSLTVLQQERRDNAGKLTSKVRLHALQSVHKHSPALEINGSLLRDQRTLNLTPRPEKMLHAAPRRLGISAEIARTIPARRETRRGLRERNINNTALVHTALDLVRLAVLRNLHRALLGGKVLLVVGEGEVVEVVGGPELGGIGDGVDDLGVELRRGADAEDVAEDDLDEAELAAVGGHVEGLGLDVGRVHDLPAQVGAGELGEGHIFGLLLDGLDGFGAVLALGDADAVEVWLLVRGGCE